MAEIPSSWWASAEGKLYNVSRAREFFEALLKAHPHPNTLIDYLNERRFILLLEILEQSECLRKFLLRHPLEFERTIPNLWYLVKEKEDYLRELKDLLSGNLSDEAFSEKLAYYRHRELMRLFAKEILGTAKLEDILREYSHLPDAMLEVVYERALEEAKERLGKPVNERGEEIVGAIIALGKHGSEELNYYSDIDLIYIHSEDKGSAARKTIPEFFSEVFRKVTKLMEAQTPEGVPYKVDLDLRPFGKTGPISLSLRAAELYYESYGRIWERFALLRARPVAGDPNLGESFMKDIVKPFVYSSADFKLIQEIRLMKQRIEAQAKKKLGKGYNLKTGEGGIREVEFTVQSLIILLGSKSSFVRERNTFRGIWKLNQKGVFSDEEALFLEEAYAFLRTLEHRLQISKCLQTQTLGEQDLPFLAKVLGFKSPQKLSEKLEEVKAGVKEIFDSLVPQRKERELDPLQIAIITEDRDFGQHELKNKGFSNPSKSFSLLLSYFYGKEGLKLSDKEKEKLLDLIPRLVGLASQSSDPDETLKNFDKFFTNPTGRKVILSDPKEDFLKGLFEVFSLSSVLSNLVSKNPDLVEDVLTLYRDYPTLERLEEEFTKYEETLNLTREDLYRRFKMVWEVRIGLLYLMGELSYENLKKLFSSLSLLADFLLQKLWTEVQLSVEPALLLSLGKLGSKELSFGSDLDLVFAVGSQEDKERVTDKVRRLVRFITAHTPEGYLYEVDFRLRPMGSKGELVPTLDFYKKYFAKEARTWERLAWTRARILAGEESLKNEMEKLIEDFLFGRDWREKERKDVYEMRIKLQEHAKRGRNLIDLKFAAGGIVDGEFLVQYLLIKEGIRETSMIGGFEKLIGRYSFLKDAYESFMFLRLVETHLRLTKERGTSILRYEDFPRLAKSLKMSPEEFEDELRKSMKTLRETFLEFLG